MSRDTPCSFLTSAGTLSNGCDVFWIAIEARYKFPDPLKGGFLVAETVIRLESSASELFGCQEAKNACSIALWC